MTAISEQLRALVVDRARGRCEYCGLPTQGQIATFPVDHVKPRTKNGRTLLQNLALACPSCNAHKWAFIDGTDPQSGGVVLLFDPREQLWTEHFKWSAVNPVPLEGKTATGRATITRLQMNSEEMLAVRRLLLELGIAIGPPSE